MSRSGRVPWSFGAAWLIRLRWWVLLAQALAVASAAMEGQRELAWPLGLLAAVALSNGLLTWLERGAPGEGVARTTSWVGPVLLADTLFLTALLQLTGGPMNPFSVLYLVHITIAAMLLDARWVWPLVAASLAGFALLFPLQTQDQMHGIGLHLQGMWLAFAVASCLIASFVSSLSRQLGDRDRELALARERSARADRLAALTSLAASAAHELGTPIGTIAIAAGELARTLEQEGGSARAREDVTLIRDEIRRCRQVLDELSTRAGELPGEGASTMRLDELLSAVALRLPADRQSRLRVEADAGATRLPRAAVTLACLSLVRNAFAASDAGAQVELHARLEGEAEVVFEVRDRGAGMSEEALARAGEPFYSTRDGGLGLGLFLVKALADRLGGRLELESALGRGTTARLVLPRSMPS
ncbi:MAG: sensor histidine kinase [Sandaracinaceae bacterium]|nr:sensor histidine kinase [Sandaracinaceae bacterium]